MDDNRLDSTSSAEDGRKPGSDRVSWGDASIPAGAGAGGPSQVGLDPADVRGLVIDGRYRIHEKIGRGGFNLVFRGHQPSLDRDVAVKFPHSAAGVEGLKRGGKLSGKLAHPAIASIIDAGETVIAGQRWPYVVMELVFPARTINQYCEQEQLDIFARLDLFARVCEGVGCAHRQRVVHRDLKAPNILVNSSGQPKVIDFDIASTRNAILPGSELQSIGTNGMILGTPTYMSPEQAAGLPVGPPSDVFSLGMVLFDLTTSCGPWQDTGLSHARKAGAVSLLPSLERISGCEPPAHIRPIIDRCLQIDAAGRYQNADELAAAIRDRGRAADPELETACDGDQPAEPTSLPTTVPLLPSRPASALAEPVRLPAGCESDPDPGNRFRRFVPAAMGMLAVATLLAFVWAAIAPRTVDNQRATAYRQALATAADSMAAGVPEAERAARRRDAAAAWSAWQGAAPLPLELICLKGLAADGGSIGDRGTLLVSPSGNWLVGDRSEPCIRVAEAAAPLATVHRLCGPGPSGRSLAFGPGDLLAAGDEEGNWRVWNIATRNRSTEPLITGTMNGGGPLGFDFAPDRQRVAAVSARGEVELWLTGATDGSRRVWRLSLQAPGDADPEPAAGPIAGAPSICFSGDSSRLLIGAAAGVVRVVDVRRGVELEPITTPAAGPVTLCRSADGSRLISYEPGGSLWLHDAATGRLLPASATELERCRAAAFLPDGTRLLVTQDAPGSRASGRTLKVFDSSTPGALKPVLSLPTREPLTLISTGAGPTLALRVGDRWQLWSHGSPLAAASRASLAGGGLRAPPSLDPGSTQPD